MKIIKKKIEKSPAGEKTKMLVNVKFIPGKSHLFLETNNPTHTVTVNVTEKEYKQLEHGVAVTVVRSPFIPFVPGSYYLAGKGKGSMWAAPIKGVVITQS